MPRTSRAALIATAGAAAVLVAYAIAWTGVSQLDIARSDFTAFYVGSALLRAGHAAAVYDGAAQAHLQASLIAPLRTASLPYASPPTATVALVPLTTLPLFTAYRVWQAVQLLLVAAAAGMATWAAPWPVTLRRRSTVLAAAVVASAGVGTLALGLLGQWDGVSAMGIATAYTLWRREARFGGGLALAVCTLLAKPHLVVGLTAFLLAWRDRRVLAGAATATLALGLVSLAAVGPSGAAAFVTSVAGDATRWPLASMLGFTGLAGSWLGNGSAAQLTAAAASLVAVLACALLGRALARNHRVLEPALAAALLLSLLASPHLLTQDLVLLTPLFAGVSAWAADRTGKGLWQGRVGAGVLAGWSTLGVAAAFDLGRQEAAPPGRLVPWALIALAAAACLLVRRQVVRAPTATAATAYGSGRGVGASPEYS